MAGAPEAQILAMRGRECAGIVMAGLSGVGVVFALTMASIGLVSSCKGVVHVIVHTVWLVGEIAVAVLAAITSGLTISMSIIASAAVAVYTLPASAIPWRVALSSSVATLSMVVAGSTLLYFANVSFSLELCVSIVTASSFAVGCAAAWSVGVMSLVERDTRRTSLKMTTILDAVRHNNHRMLRLLVNIHAGLKQRDIDIALLHAVKVGFPECTDILLSTGADSNSMDFHENTPLVLACGTGDIRIASILLNRGARVNMKSGTNGTALHHAAKWGYEDVVQLLLDRGADVNIQDGLWRTPIMLTAAHAHKAEIIMSMLIDAGSDVNILGTYGRTVLHFAAGRGLDIGVLLDAGANPNVADSDGNTTLHIAAKEGCLSVMEALLSVNCDPNAPNIQQQTPLHIAAVRAHNMECIKYLVEAGADPSLPDVTGHLPIWYATIHGHIRAVQHFIQLSVPLGPSRGDGRHSCISNPLIAALKHQHLAIAKVLLIAGSEAMPLSDWLLDIPADCAAAYYNVPYIKWLKRFPCHPSRLLHQCRLTIRRFTGKRLPNITSQLPLPRTIRSYILMEDVDDSLETDAGVFKSPLVSEPSSPVGAVVPFPIDNALP